MIGRRGTRAMRHERACHGQRAGSWRDSRESPFDETVSSFDLQWNPLHCSACIGFD
jgi:hypothetical protein